MFLTISNVARPIESLFPAICYLLINNHPVSRRSYVLALATSIVREDFSQATRLCLCPSTWIICVAANDLFYLGKLLVVHDERPGLLSLLATV